MNQLNMKQFPNQIYRTLQEKGANKDPRTFIDFSEETFRARNKAFNGIYYSPQSYDGPSNKKEHLSKINTLFADLDVAKSGDGQELKVIEEKKTMLLQELQSLPTPPSAVVATRNGLQPYWYLSESDVSEETIERCENVIESISKWATAFGSLGDPVHDIVHLLRVPNFYHHKKEPYLIKVLSEQDVTYTLAELEEVFPYSEKKEVRETRIVKNGPNSSIIDWVNNLDVREVAVRAWEHLGSTASFDKDNHLIVDGEQTATFANRDGKNFIATSSSDYPADGNAVTYVAETLKINTKEAFAWIVDSFKLGDGNASIRPLVPLTEATTSLRKVLESMPANTPKGDLPVLLEPLLTRVAKEMGTADAENFVRLTIKKWFSLTGNDVTGFLNKLRELSPDKSNKNSKSRPQAEVLVELIENEDTEFFKNETNDAFARVKVDDHYEIHSVRSKPFRLWAIGLYYKHTQGGAINSDAYQTARGVIEGRCIFEGKQYTIHPRVGRDEENFWYDLCDSKWRAVRVNKEGWSIVNEPPILFQRYSHMRPQMEPKGSAHLREIFEFINIENEDMKLLLMVWIVTCFIKGFPHTAPIIHGQKGSAKTTASEILKSIIDPSIMKTTRLPHNTKEAEQVLAHSWLTIFDNVSPDKFSGSISDLFCTVITGGGVSKRELYSDDEDVVYNLQRVVGINGILIVANKPDLLDRSILVELQSIPEGRKIVEDIVIQFEKKLPALLGGIFDTLVQAIQIKKNLPRTNLPRMADFAEWGSAIAIALGYTQEQFLNSYKNNIKQQSDTVIDDSLVATLLLALLERQNGVEWKGSATELLEELAKNEDGEKDESIKRRENFPKASNALSRSIKELKTTLADEGCYVWQTGTSRKQWHIAKTPEQKLPENLFSEDEVSTDDIAPTVDNLFDKSDVFDVSRTSTAEEDLISMYEEAQKPQNLDEDEPF